MSRYVPSSAIDHAAVHARGASSLCQPDFDLVKCTRCGGIYLLDDTEGLLYVDGNDLSRRAACDGVPLSCVQCGAEMQIGSPSGRAFEITWAELKDSAWSWAATPLASFGDPA
jgi:hypothetical protein